MFDASDPRTINAVRALRAAVVERKRPLILWLGAGVSRWCGYPSWEELALFFHSAFLRRVSKYDKDLGNSFLQARDLPAFFQACKDADTTLYNSLLVQSFGEPRPTPVFDRLIQVLSSVSPLFILTTNVDEALEKRLRCITVQRSDIERVPDLINARTSFVCKLHGTISSVETTVFTRDEYASLIRSEPFLRTIEQVLALGSAIFLGYGLRDKYVLDRLARAAESKPLFGAGPHFAVTTNMSPDLPAEIQPIKYLERPVHDHRGALQVLDIVNRSQSIVAPETNPPTPRQDAISLLSAYFIAHFLPPGVWQSSQQVLAVAPGKRIDVTVGAGFVNSEVPSGASTAMHDLIVGLICFDVVYLPFSDLTKVHDLLSSPWFWTLVNAGLLRFVHTPRQPAVIFPDQAVVDGGDIAMMGLLGKDGQPLTIEAEIRSLLNPARGMEKEVEPLFEKLATLVVPMGEERTAQLPELVRGTLLYPAVQEILGISDAFLPTKIPRWNVFPALRLANLLFVGEVCQFLRIPAARIGFGGEALVSAAFSVASAQDWADEVANYVLGSTFDTDLGEMVFQNPEILNAILQFRDTPEGISLRQRIRDLLSVNDGNEFAASVNAGLRRNIPARMLEQAKNQLSGLLVPRVAASRLTGAVWNNLRNSDSSVQLWRARSLSMLRECCTKNRIGPYDPCPCLSGEKLRFCCLQRLIV